ncbi:MAG: FtsX-like permease family protein [Acidobacteria bacterium]|nr:FtsX-like permease family protein [Acidobacteriota bacterium]
MNWRRLQFLWNRNRMERDLAEEMEAHRAMMDTPAHFGNVTRLREEAADLWGFRWLDEFLQDARHGARVFRRSPSFTLTAVAVLTLGFGVNLALFQVINATLIQPLRLRDPGTIIRLFQNASGARSSGVAYPVAEYLRNNSEVFSAMLMVQNLALPWGEATSDKLAASFVSANYFSELGAGMALGRAIQADEAGTAAVLSHQFWQTRLGGDPGVVGSSIRLNGRAVPVIGVAAANFTGPSLSPVQVWLPLENLDSLYPGSRWKTAWGDRGFNIYARLKPGVTETAAREALRTPMAELGRLYPNEVGDEPWIGTASGDAHFRRDRDKQEALMAVVLLLGISTLMLAIACSNLASLTIAHISARAGEFKMRTALGAGQGRVLRQLMAESSLLVAAGLIGGWACGYAAAQALLAEFETPVTIAPWPEWRLALGAAALAFFALFFVALPPALRLRNRGARTGMQQALVGVQVMGSCVLLLFGGMMTRKLQSVISEDLGFQFEKVAILEASLDRYGLNPAAVTAYWSAMRDAVAADPRMTGVALSTTAPLGNAINQSRYRDAPGLSVTVVRADAAFFDLLKIPLLAGRTFQPGDKPGTSVIVSQRLAQAMYGTLNVLGQGFPKTAEGQRATIIGVAADARLIQIAATDGAECYYPLTLSSMPHALLMTRVSTSQLDPLYAAARQVNPAITPSVTWMRAGFEKKLQAPMAAGLLATVLAALGLGLTAIGIFGLLAYSVSLRTKEIGIRMALGAPRTGVLWLVVKKLAIPVGAGALTGLLVVRGGLSKMLSGEPLYVDPADPLTLAVAMGTLLAAAFTACLGPVARAVRISPSSALRE